MTAATPYLPAELAGYLKRINPEEPAILAELRRTTAEHRLGNMHIAPEQAQLLAWLLKLCTAKRCLEIGVFTGYSSTALAMALPEDGHLTACDISITYTDIARRYWQQAGVAHKITLHLQPALITLDQLLENGEAGHYDFALIDADKAPTAHYYERCLQLVRPGGLIAIDNLLLGGRVCRPPAPGDSPSLQAVRRFNQALRQDPRADILTLPLGDGLTLLRKRHSEETPSCA